MTYNAEQLEKVAIPHYDAEYDDWGLGQMKISDIITDRLNDSHHSFVKEVTAVDPHGDEGPARVTISADTGFLFVYARVLQKRIALEDLPSDWKVDGTTVCGLSEAGFRKGQMQFQNRFYANVQGGFLSNGERTSEEELEAIARMMGAVPDLLRALEAAEARDEEMHAFDDLECFYDDPTTKEYDAEYLRRRNQRWAIARAYGTR